MEREAVLGAVSVLWELESSAAAADVPIVVPVPVAPNSGARGAAETVVVVADAAAAVAAVVVAATSRNRFGNAAPNTDDCAGSSFDWELCSLLSEVSRRCCFSSSRLCKYCRFSKLWF